MATTAIMKKKGVLKDLIKPVKNLTWPKDQMPKMPKQMPMKPMMDQMPLKMRKMMPKKDEGGGMIPTHIKERMRRQANLV